jgi:hypothetical protein
MKRLVAIFTVFIASAGCMPAGAQAAFGIDGFDVSFTTEDGSPSAQAGSHPFAFTTSFEMNESGGEAEGRLRELFLDEMPGLTIDPSAVPRCADEDFETLNEGINDCSDGTAVGIFQSASGDPGSQTTVPIFNLVPPPGALMRLGFRLAGAANVVVDFELSPEPPYRLLATVGEVPETVELFAAELQLWGVPAAPAHDEFRGGCAVDGVVGSCPTSNPQRPFLTLPTSCEGPQETFYEALSWEGDEDFGGVFTHDDAGDPLGFIGCGKLAFDPLTSVHLTTDEAQSPTGLDASVAFADEGLLNPSGIAQSQVRDLVVALSGGLSPGPSLASAKGSCSEADLEAEAPESAGCPATSRVGTAEVESPLAEGRLIHGTVYRATPDQNLAGDAARAFYIVLEDAGLGVSIAQPVALETDSATGELLAIAEEMPQLPFSHLRLHLDDGEGGPLVSPPLCGEYEAETELGPWAWEEALWTSSAFQIVSGPNGGPCPTGAPRVRPLPTPPASAPVVSHRRHCRKGKHRVHRKGKVRCVKRRHHKHRRRHRHSR